MNVLSILRSPVEIPFSSVLFCGIKQWALRFCSMTHHDITIGNDVAGNIHCDMIMGHDVVMGAYHVTMHTDVARTLIYYVLLCPIMIFLFYSSTA